MRKMQHETVRRILLIAYGCTLLSVFPVCLGISLVPDVPLVDNWGVLCLLAAMYLPHQICIHLHMRKNYRVISFQSMCLVIDLIAVVGYAFMSTRMIMPGQVVCVAWCMTYVVAQRTVILLRMLRKMPDWW